MAIGLSGYRTFYLTVRIRDEASRGAQAVNRAIGSMGEEADRTNQRLQDVGRGLMSTGTFMAGVGATGIGVLSSFTKEALDFSQQVAYAFTQVDEAGATMQQVEDIAKRVADKVPVPLDQLAEGLYDIFSSIDISVEDSEHALEKFAKASIAGQTDVRTAARSTVAVMNAFNLTTEDTGKLLDWQFQLVRKGVGTYEDFAGTIGLALPAFRAADQDLETLGGSLTFLTRQGLSTSRAATSAARAMELLATPKAVENLRKAGIEVTNADGSFRQMNDIVTDLAEGPFKDLTGPKFREAFKEIFGTGRIQARRFFDIALKNAGEYNQRVEEFIDMQGAMETAYDIMYNEPIMRSQELSVQFDLLKQEIGERLIPAFERLVGWAQAVVDWWDELHPKTKDLAVQIAAVSSVALLAGGAFIFMAGGALVLTSVMKGLLGLMAGSALVRIGLSLLAWSWPIAAVVVVVAALAYAIWKLWPYIKELGERFVEIAKIAWDYLAPIADTILEAMKKAWQVLASVVKDVWDKIVSIVSTAWGAVKEVSIAFGKEVSEKVSAVWQIISDNAAVMGKLLVKVWDILVGKIKGIVKQFQQFWDIAWVKFWELTGEYWKILWKGVQEVFDATLTYIGVLWSVFKNTFETSWNLLWNVAQITFETVWTAISTIAKSLLAVLQTIFEEAADVLVAVWDTAWQIVETGFEVFLSAINLLLSIFTGDWDQAWQEIKDIFQSIWDSFEEIANLGWQVVEGIFNTMKTFFLELGTTLVELLHGAINWLFGVGKEVAEGLIGGFMSLFAFASGTQTFASRVWAAITGIFIDAGSWLFDVGKNMMNGLWNGFAEVFDSFWNWLKEKAGWFGRFIPDLGLGGGELNIEMDAATRSALEEAQRQEKEYADRLARQQESAAAARRAAEQAGVQPESLYNPFGMYMFAKGGIVTQPTSGIVGEAGPEAVIPLTQLGQFMNGGGGDSGGGITVNVYGTAGEDDVTFARRVALAVGEEVFANGY